VHFFFLEYLHCTEYYFRVEYQHRGSPHVHGLVWMPDAVDIAAVDVDLNALTEYVDDHISTMNPREDAERLPGLALRAPIHPASVRFSEVEDVDRDYSESINTFMRHTNCQMGRCLQTRKLPNGASHIVCRMGFPKPHKEVTQCRWVEVGGQTQRQTTAQVQGVAVTVTEDMAAREVDLDLAAVEAIAPAPIRRLVIDTKRNDTLLVSHSPTMLHAWRANCELQAITSTESLKKYLIKYLNKPEHLSEFLKRILEMAASSHSSNHTAKRAIQSFLMATVGCRDYSAQESAHHILQLPLYFCSRHFETLNTSGLKSVNEDGELPNYLDRYQRRHADLEECCLFLFVKRYSTTKARGALPPLRREEIVVVVKPRYTASSTKEVVRELFHQQQMILFVSWRGDFEVLKGDFATWREAHEAANIVTPLRICMDDIVLVEEDDVVEETAAVDQPAAEVLDESAPEVDVNRSLPPPLETEPFNVGTHDVPHPPAREQDDWMAVQEDPGRHFNEGIAGAKAYATVNQDPNAAEWQDDGEEWDLAVAGSFLADMRLQNPGREHTIVSPNSLNDDQMNVFHSVMMHAACTDAAKAPFLAVVLGTAGTGKSHLVHALRGLLDQRCIVVAPTGVAACNIEGDTIHSKLCIPVANFKSLSADSLLEMQDKLNAVEYVFIDEISMVGKQLLGMVDARLRQIFSNHSNVVFGGRSVVFFGDFGQLPPVCDTSVYEDVCSKARSQLAVQGRLAYLQVSRAFFLDIVVRQDGDRQFRDLLMRLHEGIVTPADWELLCSRDDVSNLTAEEPFVTSLRLYPTRDAVFEHNLQALRNTGKLVAVIEAVHPANNMDKRSKRAESDVAGGLVSTLALCVGARVMLVHNLWVERRLVNGSVGVVRAIIYAPGTRPPQLPQVVFVDFPDYTGPRMPNGVVPITPRTFHWTDKGKQCARTQLPLILCWATTIHKSQGLTLNNAVIHLGSKEMCSGLTYVALSRVRRLDDLCLYPVDFDRLLAIANSKSLWPRKAEVLRLKALPQNVFP
jgi:PIF1-like helicase